MPSLGLTVRVFIFARVKIDQVGARLNVRYTQYCCQGSTPLVELTMLMSIVRSIVVRC